MSKNPFPKAPVKAVKAGRVRFGDGTGGDGKWAPYLSRAAVAAGCDGLFWETHRNPPEAMSDKDNALPLGALGPLWRQCRGIDELA